MFIYTDNENLKDELKKSMIDNKVTAKQLADIIEVKPQQFNNIINKVNFSFADMKRICDAMNCDLVLDIVKRD